MECKTSARMRWRGRHQGRNGARGPNYPPELSEEPRFLEWLMTTVEAELDSGEPVDWDLEVAYKFPFALYKKYWSVYAFGYHFRIKSAETFSEHVILVYPPPLYVSTNMDCEILIRLRHRWNMWDIRRKY